MQLVTTCSEAPYHELLDKLPANAGPGEAAIDGGCGARQIESIPG